MRSRSRTQLVSLLTAHALCLAPLLAAQDSRPRRVPRQPNEATQTKADPQARTDSQTKADPQAATETPPATPRTAEPTLSTPEAALARFESEPLVRVGLATNARAVNISTSGQLLLASNETGGPRERPEPLAASRVRVEPRVLGRLPQAPAGESAADKSRPQTNAEKSRPRTNANKAQTNDGEPQSNAAGSRPQAANDATPDEDGQQASGVRLASRAATPERGLAVYAGGAVPLLHARAPVTFAAADEEAAPLHFGGKPYRGLIEVFTNTNNSLTVVNVVRLEDYIRGVVPEELSPFPNGWPALEAHKAQAVAARAYALSHRGRYAAAGFDLLPTTSSQVYGGKASEHPLSTRAVQETRGVVAIYAGRPIKAFYTSTCGGHTEDGGAILNEREPYLRGRACAHPELSHAADTYALTTLQTSRELPAVRVAEHARSPRDLALLTVHGLRLDDARPTDDWLEEDLELDEARRLLELAARLARRPVPALVINSETVRPPGFATAIAHALDGESRAGVLLDAASVEYLLSFRDAADIPAPNRADVALLLRDGHLALHPDATLRPRQELTRARAFRVVASVFESRGLFNLQKATVRPTTGSALVVRGAKGPERTLDVAADAHLFRAYGGETLYAVRTLPLVGGEAVVFHADARGRADYLEARPATSGAAAERFSPYTNWTAVLTPADVSKRLGRRAARVGSIVDLRVAARGVSRRVLDLEVVGTAGTTHVRGGAVRSALRLNEQLFFIDRRYDESGRVASFVLTGRGLGHGVGLCQVGAYGLARAGLTYDRILKHYYTGIELARMY